MAKMKGNLVPGVKAYSIPLVLGALSLGATFFVIDQNREVDKLESDIVTMEALYEESAATDASISGDFDKEAHVEVIKGRTVSAEAIGEAMIAADNALTEFYKTNEPFPEDQAEVDKMMAKLEAAQAENTRLTGAGEADHIDTWKLNPEWNTTLESVVVYQDTQRVPIVFSMKTKDGESAGLIYAIYDTETERLDDIGKHYTTAGMLDAVDVGGI